MMRMWNEHRTSVVGVGLLILCIVIFVAQGLTASPHKSASFDEQYHLSAGYSYLRTGDYRMATTHPPLVALLAGTGLLPLSDISLPLDDPSWESGDRYRFSDVFVWERNDQSVRMIEFGRIPLVVVLGSLLLITVAVWSWTLFGKQSMWLALVLTAFEPNLVANARIIATDFGVTVFLFVSVWAFWRWLQKPGPSRAVLFGLLAGMAMAAKYSGLMIWPIALLILLIDPKEHVTSLRVIVRDGALSLAAAMAVLWLIYGFDVGWIEAGEMRLPALAPFYWRQLLNTAQGLMTGDDLKLNYMLGQVSQDGWWYYLPIAYLFKTPIALMILTTLGLITVAIRKQWRMTSALWAPVVVFTALGITGFVTLGYRHLLPVVPFTILLASNSVNLTLPNVRVRRLYAGTLAALVLWVTVSSLRFYPNQESYFNELAGGWTNWSHLLVDSDLDWGQDLPALADKMDALGIERVNLGYFGNAVPEKYGVRYDPLPGYIRFINGYELNAYNPSTPAPGWYAISASSLRLGAVQPGTEDLYAFFRDKEPDARAGYSIYLYKVDYPPDAEWMPVVVVDETVADFMAARSTEDGEPYFQARWLRNADSEILLNDAADEVLDAAQTVVGANFEDVFSLAAYDKVPYDVGASGAMELLLYWQRRNGPAPMPAPTQARSVSVFVQVVNSESGAVVAQYDGWDTAMRGLQQGDVVRQRVALELPSDMEPGEYRVIAGLYTPQTGRRLTVQAGDELRDSLELFAFELP